MTTIVTGHLCTAAEINQWCPAGACIDYAGSAAPSGWLLCDGASYLRTDYAALFTAIGTTYGSADGTHFNVPDARGRVPVGYAASGGHTDVATLGNNDGVAAANRRPKHNSTVVQPTISAPTITITPSPAVNAKVGSVIDGSGTFAGAAGVGLKSFNETAAASAPVASGGTVGPGGTAPVDTPAYIVLNKIIRAMDV